MLPCVYPTYTLAQIILSRMLWVRQQQQQQQHAKSMHVRSQIYMCMDLVDTLITDALKLIWSSIYRGAAVRFGSHSEGREGGLMPGGRHADQVEEGTKRLNRSDFGHTEHTFGLLYLGELPSKPSSIPSHPPALSICTTSTPQQRLSSTLEM